MLISMEGILMNQIITELTEDQLHQMASIEIGRVAILFTSPFCGTCKVALTMLQIVQAVGVPYSLYQANINYTPYFRELWQLRSIPALVLIHNGKLIDIVYAIQSVDSLYAKLQIN